MRKPQPPQPPRPPRPRQLTPRPVQEAGFGPAEEIAVARAELDAAQADIEVISQALLDRLLRSSIKRRFRHFDDPDLTPAHRLLLRASVEEDQSGPPSLWRTTWQSIGNLPLRLRPPPRVLVAAGLTCGVLGWGLDALISRNGELARVTAITTVVGTKADGSSVRGHLGPGVALVVERDGDGLRARQWVQGVGYDTYIVDPSAVEVQQRSVWQTFTAFADALANGWRRPAARQ